MIDYKIFDKIKDEATLRLLYDSTKKKAQSELEVKVIDAAAKKAIQRIKGETNGQSTAGKG